MFKLIVIYYMILGGVGKSTVSVNLAAALSQHKSNPAVGILGLYINFLISLIMTYLKDRNKSPNFSCAKVNRKTFVISCIEEI